MKPRNRKLLGWSIGLALLLALLAGSAWAGTQEGSGGNALEQAWGKAQASGAYHYDTTIVQTVRPLPRLENVGLSSQETRFYLQGETDLAQHAMQLALWSQGGGVASEENRLELRVQDGQAQGRLGGEAWQSLDDPTQLFAPGQDALSYLAAARNVVDAGQETRSGITFTRYTFDIDGPAFAEYMRQSMQAELQRTGRLPMSLSLDLNRQYVGMAASGELWLGEGGLPLRQIVSLAFPPDERQQVTANITTDFSGWAVPQALLLGFIRLPAGWVDGVYLAQLAFAALCLALAGWLVFQRRSRLGYAALAVVVVVSMLLTPLLQSQQVRAFYQSSASPKSQVDTSQEDRSAEENRAAEDRAAENLLTASETDSPAAAENLPPSSPEPLQPVSLPLSRLPDLAALPVQGDPPSTLDSDQDGLTDIQEDAILTDPQNPDSDGDGLFDGVEVNELATDPLEADTDGDGLDDQDELLNHTDPLILDTNHDEQVDGVECFNVVSGAAATCEDTDGGGVPDVLDFDNDNDGVPDTLDLSPTRVMGGGVVGSGENATIAGIANQTFNFSTAGLSPDQVTLVDFQLRPVNPEHLWYTLNVLDWPSNDRSGQQRRVTDSTFGASGKDANGDLRLIPLLEILIPAQNGFGGLPATVAVLPPFPIDPNNPPQDDDFERISAWLDSWLNRAALDQYGISVRPKDRQGNLVVNVPLNLVRQQTGDSPVAFAGRMFYQPTGTDLGLQQQVRLAWLLYGLQDTCRAVPEDFEPTKTESERFDDWCKDSAHWDTRSGVIHTYYDDWFLTGLQVQEYEGIDFGVVFETYPRTNPNYESNLWHLADLLGETFLVGRPVTDTLSSQPVVIDVDEIFRRWNSGSTATMDERWNVPVGALQVIRYDFDEPGELVTLSMTHTKTILAEYFTDGNGGPLVEAPTLLFTRQERSRSAALDMPGASLPGAGGSQQGGVYINSSLTVNLSDIQPQTIAGMNWAPYRCLGAGVWEAYPIDEYWESLDPALENEFALLDPNEDELHRAGGIVLAQSMYLSLFVGATKLVGFGDVIDLPAGLDETEININYFPSKAAGKIVKELVKEIGERLAASTKASAAGAAATGASKTASSVAKTVDVKADLGTIKTTQLNKGAASTSGGALAGLYGKPAMKTAGKALAWGAIVTSCTLYALKEAKRQGVEGLDTAIEAVYYTDKVVSAAKVVYDIGKAVSEFDKLRQGTAAVSKAAKTAAVIGLIIEVAVAIGLFLYQVISAGVTFLSLAFDLMLAGLIATIIVAVIMFAIAMIPVIGPLIVAILAGIDVLISLICKWTGGSESENWFVDTICDGISANLVKLVQFLIYSQNPLVDIQHENRFLISGFRPFLDEPDQGFQAENILGVSLSITNTLFTNSPNSWMAYAFFWQYGLSHVKKSVFAYEFQPTKQDIHAGLVTGSQYDDWNAPAQYGGTVYMTQDLNSIDDAGVPLLQAGINLTTTLYLAEGYKIKTQECITVWFFGPIPICWLREEGKTLHTDLSGQLVFDVFPNTLDGFYALTSRGSGNYALAWDARFPTLADADGDGLRSRAFGGNDPDDGTPDIDQDGLSDFYEIQTGTDPQIADTDHDGLNDFWERFYGCDPRRADTDSDGLPDPEELAGWSFVYDFDDDSRPLYSRVTSDPLLADTDGDKISDKLEKVYGFNPRAWSELNVIRLASGVLEEDGSGDLVASDGFARPGDTLYYTATVENELNQRFADGLLEVDFPAAIEPLNLEPQSFSLVPYNPDRPYHRADLTGSLEVDPDIAATQQVTLTNRAGALISPTLSSSARVLWLHLNQADYLPGVSIPDESYKDNTVTCQYCPSSAPDSAFFDGANDYLIANGQALDLAQPAYFLPGESGFTLAVWVNPESTSITSYRGILGSGVRLSATGYPGIWLHGANIYTRFGDGSSYHSLETTGDLVKVGEWNHVIASYDGTVYRVWINGSLVASANVSASSLAGGHTVSIGKVDTYFRGNLRGVEIFPRGFSEEEVRDLYGYSLLLHMAYESDARWVDSSLHNQQIINHGATFVDDPQQGGAAEFSGADYLEVATSQSLVLDSQPGFSLSAWLKPAAVPGTTLIGNWDASVWLSGTTLSAQVQTTAGPCTASANILDSDPNTWQHVLVSFGANHDPNYPADYYWIFYQDGDMFYRQACSSALDGLDDSFSIGGGYRGRLDELRIYNRPVDASEARMLAGGQALWLRFDEQPGSSQFVNSASSSVAVNPCSQEAGDCPLSGLPGRIDQAAYFDGSNRSLTASGFELKADRPVGFSQAAWIFPTFSDSGVHGILGSTISGADSYPSLWVEDVTELGAGFGNTTTGCQITTTTDPLTPHAWNHVAATFDGINYTLFVNGVQVATSNNCQGKTPSVVSEVAVGRVSGNYFRGYIDDVSLFTNKVLDELDISGLMDEAPKIYLRLDEPLLNHTTGITTTLFDNTNPQSSYGPGTCSLDPQVGDCACPRAGADGWMRSAPVFNVTDVEAGFQQCIKVDTGSATSLSSFTVGGWFKPTKRIGNFDQNLAQSNSFELGITNQMTVTFDVTQPGAPQSPQSLQASGRLVEDQWNHVMATYDSDDLTSTYTMTIYINGFPQGELTNSTPKVPNNESIQFANGLNGMVDELVLYDYVLAPQAIQKMYAYQVRWYDTTAAHKIVIDAIPPTASLDYALPNIGVVQDQVLAVQAEDDASGVRQVEYQISGQGAPSGWQAAVQDRDAWVFPITTLAGQYTIQVRAVDQAGNQSAPASKTLVVDGTPPNPTLNSSLVGTVLQPVNDRLSLYGAVTDASSSVAGLDVALLDSQGVIVGAAQHALLSGGSWSVEYPIPQDTGGSFNVRLTAWDSLGNSGVFTRGPVLVDSLAPVADVTFTGVSTTTISGSPLTAPTILGTVDETPYPTNPLLRLHLEEEAGASQFYDSASHRWVGSCTGACPLAHVTGKAGYAASFSGGQDIRLPISNTLDVENTLSVWIRPNWAPTSASTLPAVAGIREGSLKRFSVHILGDYSGIGLWNGTNLVTFPASLLRAQWQHLAVVIALDQATVYLDGVSLGSQDFTPGNAHGLPLHVGSADGAQQYFTGAIDEVALYDRALSPGQVDGIAHPVGSGVDKVEIGFLHEKDTAHPETILWRPGGLMKFDQPYSTWMFRAPAGLEGPYFIYLRLTDNLGNQRILANVWQGEIDTLAPRLTYLNRQVQVGGQTWYEVQCRAEDYNLDESTFNCPNNAAATLEYNQEAWFKAIYPGQKLFAMQTPSVFLSQKVGEMSACDLFGNCRTSGNKLFFPLVTRSSGAFGLAGTPAPRSQPPLIAQSLILTPTNGSVLTSLEPVSITGYASAPDLLGRLDLFAAGSLVFSQDWSADRLEQVSWSAAWTPPGEGAFNLDEIAHDAAGGTIAGPPITLYVDLTPPQVSLGTTSIGVSEWANGGFIFLQGWFEEAAGLARLQVRVERQGAAEGISDAWQDLPLPVGTSGEWQGYAYTGLPRPPVGETITVTIRAVDHAGRQVEVSAVLWADAPEAFDLP